MKIRTVLAAWMILATAMSAANQEGAVIGEGQAEQGALEEALAPKEPMVMRSIRLVRDDVGSPAVAPSRPRHRS